MIRDMETEFEQREEDDDLTIYIVKTTVTLHNGDTFVMPTLWTNKDIEERAGSPKKMAQLIATLIENTIGSISDMAEFRTQGLVS